MKPLEAGLSIVEAALSVFTYPPTHHRARVRQALFDLGVFQVVPDDLFKEIDHFCTLDERLLERRNDLAGVLGRHVFRLPLPGM